MKYFSIPILSIALLALLGAGCNPFQSAQERAIEQSIEAGTDRDVDVDLRGDSVSVTDEETGGTMTAGEEVDFPSDFPSDIPRYPKGTLKMVSSQLGEAGQATYLMQTDDDSDAIMEWFKGEATGDGWKQKASLDIQGMVMLTYEREEGGSTYVMTVAVTEDDDEDVRNINVTRAEQ
jgi:hypothetical protein